MDVFRDQRDNIFMPRVTLPDYLGLVTIPHSNVEVCTATDQMVMWSIFI